MNFIQIKNKKIELTDNQINEIKESLGIKDVRLSEIPVGDTFKIGEYEFIVLQNDEGEATVILKNTLKTSKFSENNNNYRDSEVDIICNDFADCIADLVGADNIVSHSLDLTSDDGLKDYGVIERRMSLITTEMYRRFVSVFDKHKLNKWWWLATADSTKTHNDDRWVKCVAPSGYICFDCRSSYIGVRPFCILKSNIFVSK